MVCIDNCF